MPITPIAAKFPAAIVAQADLGGPLNSIPANELVLNTSLLSTDTSVVATVTIPTTFPTSGWLTIDSEVMHYSSYTGSTFTIDVRGAQTAYGAGVAAAHTSGATIGLYYTAQALDQLRSEVIAVENLLGVQGGSLPYAPNLVLNSDFGRRTVFGLAMPETFADTAGLTIDVGTVGTVAANLWTMGTVGQTTAHWGLPTWRDCRVSAQFKATDAAAAGVYDLLYTRYTNTNNAIRAYCNNGNFVLDKVVASVTTGVATVAQALTTNNFYWIEIEAQGTTIIARLYSSGAAAVAKSSAALLQTLTGTVADTALAAGYVGVQSLHTTNAGQWGGVAASPGGVYVETWLPESWAVTFGGTLGGQAIGYDESADSGPLTKQWTPITYIPAASRTITATFDMPDGSMAASTSYTASVYDKISGLGGTGALFQMKFDRMSSALVSQGNSTVNDANDAAYARKTVTATTEAGTRRGRISFLINPASTATGTARFSLFQLEQGSAATAWRNAPEDGGASMKFQKAPTLAPPAITSVAKVEIDSRDLALNLFLPWDAVVELVGRCFVSNGTAGNQLFFDFTIDGLDPSSYGTSVTLGSFQQAIAGYYTDVTFVLQARLAAGKHRIAMRSGSTAGTNAFSSNPIPLMTITASRGK